MKLVMLSTVAILAGSTAFAGGAGPAPAPIAQPVAPLPVASTDWTGGYAGASLGYGDVEVQDDELDLTADGDGGIGGLFAGYQYDLGSIVLGAELDLNTSNIDLDNDAGSLDQVHRLKLRAGYDAGKALIYGVAGAAYAKVDAGPEDVSETGYVVGGGVDYMLTDNVIAGGEVLYHNFDEFDGSSTDVDATTVQARISYKF